MYLLCLNSGSMSLNYCLYDLEKDCVFLSGSFESIGTENSCLKFNSKKIKKYIGSHVEALKLLNIMFEKNNVDTSNIIYIAHRIVHGGNKYTEPTIVNNAVLDDIISYSKITPLHNSVSVDLIKMCQNLFTNSINVAIFDTSFHLTIPKENYMYALPQYLYDDYGIRKYGFHGISYSNALRRYSEYIGANKEKINAVMCHLGGGSSMCCIKDGKSIDTTMEYSPLSGMIMANRIGNIDPSVIFKLCEILNCSIEDVINYLNYNCGYKGIIGDREATSVVNGYYANDEDALLLVKMLRHDFKKHLFSMISNLNYLDSIILTGTISAKNKKFREFLISDLGFLGVTIDNKKNNELFNEIGLITTDYSKIPIYVIPSNEQLEMILQCKNKIKEINR